MLHLGTNQSNRFSSAVKVGGGGEEEEEEVLANQLRSVVLLLFCI